MLRLSRAQAGTRESSIVSDSFYPFTIYDLRLR